MPSVTPQLVRVTSFTSKEMVDRLAARFPELNTYDLPRRILPLLNVMGLELEFAAAPTS